jgi:hypothetical protein
VVLPLSRSRSLGRVEHPLDAVEYLSRHERLMPPGVPNAVILNHAQVVPVPQGGMQAVG